ncbi:hypothetical protein OOU_Y34scaffold00510g9 [Pyricularia oryzae Y34]|uniref:Uncharacterized protein n=2 Tax=Pyricularia oryzae TaxID=318829 RepID=A0AA97NZM9_PYRO3|nr:hypothetical protein OOU_Y34scaffold00510g9 [Pyricularia oryzae Y34]
MIPETVYHSTHIPSPRREAVSWQHLSIVTPQTYAGATL